MHDHHSNNQTNSKPLPGDRMRSVLSLSDLTATEKNVMVALAYHDGPGGCKPSIEALAGTLNIHRITLYEHLKSIREKGYLSWQKWQSTNLYTLVYEPLTVRKFQTVKESADCKEITPPDCKEIPYTKGEGNKGRREKRNKGNRFTKKGISNGGDHVSDYDESSTGRGKEKKIIGYRDEFVEGMGNIPVPVYED